MAHPRRRGRHRQPPGEESTDGELLRAAETRPEAFGLLYDRHGERIHGWLLRQGLGEAAAADLLAEAFAQAWLSRRRFADREDGNAGPWLQGISRNLVLTYRRRHRIETAARQKLGVRLDLVTEADTDGVAARVDADAARTRLHEAFSALPDHQSAAVDLRVMGGLPYADVAETLGCTDTTARKRVSLGLQALRTHLGGQP
jgi:RNA polymerase sigma factor (sigma-70 family)